MSVSILPAVDKNVFVSGSCDSLAKVKRFFLYIYFFYIAFVLVTCLAYTPSQSAGLP